MQGPIRLTALIAVLAASFNAIAGGEPAPPNIVFMLSDDQSWNGLSVAMHPDMATSRGAQMHTPNLERLAREGMRFSAAYAPASVCSPTRASLITGMNPARLHWTKAGPSLRANANPKLIPPRSQRDLDTRTTTFAELLDHAGYNTAHFGKWHLSGGGPERHGFDVSDGNLGNEAAAKFKDPNPVDIFGMADRAAQFMERSKTEGNPFFIQLSWHALHSPENALEATLKKYRKAGTRDRQASRAAITEDLDTGVGRVLDAIDRLGLADNTYVIYMSDNGGGGGGGRRGPLSGGKGSLWEGGIRVPLIIRGPDIATNSWCHVPVIGSDLFPTYLDWAGIDDVPPDVRTGLEGASIAGLVTARTRQVDRPHEELVFHFPHYQTADGPHSAIILDNHKLIRFYETERTALFDLSTDISERNDLAEAMPDRARDLAKRLALRLSELGAQMPEPNTAYDPDRPTQTQDRPGRRQRPQRNRRGN